MASVRDHYDTVLSEYYSRMFGEFDAKVAEQHALLERLGVTAGNGAATAVDLGCGSVKVQDRIWVRRQDGWRFRKGVYRKLRLAPEAVTIRLEQAGFTVERHQAPAGMVALVGVSVGQRRS